MGVPATNDNTSTSNVVALPPSLPECLTKALEAPKRWVQGAHGFEEVEGRWAPPALVTVDMADSAARALAWMEAEPLADAEPAKVRRWLVSLGNAVAGGGLGAQEVEMKISALATVLEDFPAGAFTKQSLKRAAMRFKWFPAAAELGALLDEEASTLRRKRDRLAVIAKGPRDERKVQAGALPAGPRTLAPEIQAQLDRFLGRTAPEEGAA